MSYIRGEQGPTNFGIGWGQNHRWGKDDEQGKVDKLEQGTEAILRHKRFKVSELTQAKKFKVSEANSGIKRSRYQS
nr:hypothetical protein [Mycoplasmopsis bovis]